MTLVVNNSGQKSGKLTRFVNMFKRKQSNVSGLDDNNTANFGNNTQSLLVNMPLNTSSNSVVFSKNLAKMNKSAMNHFEYKSNATEANNFGGSVSNLTGNKIDEENLSSFRQPSQLQSQSIRDATGVSGQGSTTLSNFKNRFFNKENPKAADSIKDTKHLGAPSAATFNANNNSSNTYERDRDDDEVSLGSREGLNYSTHHLNSFGNTNQFQKDLQTFETRLTELLPLPSFLLTVEEYNQIPEPQLKNFNHREVSKVKGVSSMDRVKYKSA